MPSVAIPFIARENWREFCRISDDLFAGSIYDRYLVSVQKIEQDALAEGFRPVKIDMNPADVAAWCLAHGKRVDHVGRSDYAAARLVELEDEE